MKILDENIDSASIKCWCIFGDPSFDSATLVSEDGNGFWNKTKELSGKAWNATKNAASKTWEYTTAKIGRATKHATIGRKHNSFAFMQFSAKLEDGKKHKYVFTYNYKKNRWYLLNDGLGIGNSTSAFPSTEEIMSFLQSKFARKFIATCSKYIRPWLKDDAKLDKMIYAFQHAGGNIVDMLNVLKKNKESIVSNMFDLNVIVNTILTVK